MSRTPPLAVISLYFVTTASSEQRVLRDCDVGASCEYRCLNMRSCVLAVLIMLVLFSLFLLLLFLFWMLLWLLFFLLLFLLFFVCF